MRWKSGVLFGGVIALCGITARSQTIGRDVTGPHQSPPINGHPAIYVARVMAVSATGKDVFLACMRQRGVSLWHRLKRDGLLVDQTVFETTSVEKSAAGVPRWNFLVLSHLAPSITPETFFKAEGRGGGQRVGTTPCDAPGVETRRVEVLHSTPNSYYPSLASSDRDANAPEFIVPYIVEYIAVRDTSAALDQYRETMRSNIGPAVGQLIRDNWFVNLIALETVSVVYTQPTMPSWNQIHIRGYFPEKGATPAALDEALRRVNPQSGGYAGVFAPLDAIRTWAREDVARPLRELAVR